MKNLQNNFTTPEQSKRLLELGVPILTADCYYYVHEVNGKNIYNTPLVVPFGMGEYGLKHWWADKYNDRYIPCWSVGRLMKIIKTCTTDKETLHDFFNMLELTSDELDILMRILADEEGILNMDIDFSKLEE